MFDFVNSLFEFFAIFAIWLSIRKCYKERSSKGVHWAQVVFYCSWGFWNVLYYPSVGHWVSAMAGLGVAVSNSIWAALLIKYRGK